MTMSAPSDALSTQKTAVVFAYHSVGVRCIKTLLARSIKVLLVVTHEDNPNETIWFDSVVALCHEQELPYMTPENAAGNTLFEQIKTLQPDFIFSFYYRNMLPANLLALAKFGAYNVHGSLLPKYRGRVPVNWAVLHGETETGASLHAMVDKPDAGGIVAQTAVPILPDDTAFEVFCKLTVAAEQTLWSALPDLINGSAVLHTNDLTQGSYFGGRKPEDGRIDWSANAQQVYNLHRAVAPPYPGAFTDIGNKRIVLEKARLSKKSFQDLPSGLHVMDNAIFGVCGDGLVLQIDGVLLEGKPISAIELASYLDVSGSR
jgi:methionyl-tRNA formyltransferase